MSSGKQQISWLLYYWIAGSARKMTHHLSLRQIMLIYPFFLFMGTSSFYQYRSADHVVAGQTNNPHSFLASDLFFTHSAYL